MTGKIVLKKAGSGKFRFQLVSTNGKAVATSETHANKPAATRAIAAMRKALVGAKVEDQTTPTAKKTTAKKTAAKKTAKKSPAKKTAAKKTTAKRSGAAKTSSARSASAVRKTTAKRTTAKSAARKRAATPAKRASNGASARVAAAVSS